MIYTYNKHTYIYEQLRSTKSYWICANSIINKHNTERTGARSSIIKQKKKTFNIGYTAGMVSFTSTKDVLQERDLTGQFA